MSDIKSNKQMYKEDVKKHGGEQVWNYRDIKLQALRAEHGAWCGYMFTTMDLPESVEKAAHGGITYGDREKVGFDCAHLGDWVPQFGDIIPQGTYRTFEFVKDVCERMADKLLE